MSIRLKWPLEVIDGRFATVDQDSDEDIAQCLLAIARTRSGERTDVPGMHLADLEFSEQPIGADELAAGLERWEPRVTVLASENPNRLEQTIADIELEWTNRTNADG